MARKKKRLTRKQLKQQRQAAIARKREERGWTRPSPRANRAQHEVLEDMLPLFPQLAASSALPEAGMEQVMMSLMDSSDLAEEPEFEEMIIDPMLCINTFVSVGEELGIGPGSGELEKLADEEREDAQMKMLEMTIERLLTDEIRQDVINALDKLRRRLKQSNKRKEAARAAALQLFLDKNESNNFWTMVGLVQALVHRSLTAGFELLEVSREVVENEGLDENVTPLTLSQKLEQSNLTQKAARLLKKIPGLSGFLEKQVDNIWDEGMEAIFNGELYLELYTLEELAAGFEIFKTVLGITSETDPQKITSFAITDEKAKTLFSRLDDYLTELFTPERLDQLRVQLDTILSNSDHPEKWTAFILMLTQYLRHEEAVENEKLFLMRSLLGEMRVASAALEQAEEE